MKVRVTPQTTRKNVPQTILASLSRVMTAMRTMTRVTARAIRTETLTATQVTAMVTRAMAQVTASQTAPMVPMQTEMARAVLMANHQTNRKRAAAIRMKTSREGARLNRATSSRAN